jgi:hypothetical protein
MSCGNKNLYIPRRLLRKFYFSLNFISNRKKEKKNTFFVLFFQVERERGSCLMMKLESKLCNGGWVGLGGGGGDLGFEPEE